MKKIFNKKSNNFKFYLLILFLSLNYNFSVSFAIKSPLFLNFLKNSLNISKKKLIVPNYALINNRIFNSLSNPIKNISKNNEIQKGIFLSKNNNLINNSNLLKKTTLSKEAVNSLVISKPIEKSISICKPLKNSLAIAENSEKGLVLSKDAVNSVKSLSIVNENVFKSKVKVDPILNNFKKNLSIEMILGAGLFAKLFLSKKEEKIKDIDLVLKEIEDKKSAYKEKFYKDLGFIATFKYLGFKTKKLINPKILNNITKINKFALNLFPNLKIASNILQLGFISKTFYDGYKIKNLDSKINELLNKKEKFKLSINENEKRKIQEFLLMKYNAKI